jgi:hypothetical protein
MKGSLKYLPLEIVRHRGFKVQQQHISAFYSFLSRIQFQQLQTLNTCSKYIVQMNEQFEICEFCGKAAGNAVGDFMNDEF